MLSLRPINEDDLSAVANWLSYPHIARWWLADTTVEAVIAKYKRRIARGSPTTMLIVLDNGVAVGWCQWYCWADYPAEAAAIDAHEDEVGIDYAVGVANAIGRGIGTAMIAELVAEVRRHQPGAGVLVDPDATNTASRRVLEKNGFALVAVRPVATESNDAPKAIYRLRGESSGER